MAAGIPVNRSIAWIALIPQLFILLLIIYIYFLFQLIQPILLGGLTYLLISYVLRTYVVIDFTKGMQLCKAHQFKEAIPHFEKSISFFKEKKWLDKYRYVLLLSSSKMTYKEMSLCNIAFCYSQIGEPGLAKNYYKNILEEFPDNAIATAALRMINSFEGLSVHTSKNG